MKLPELQNNDKKLRKLRSKKLSESWEDIEEVLYYQNLLYVLRVICFELISRYHNNLLANHIGIKKRQELIAGKYYRLTLQKNIKVYVKEYNIYLALKVVCHKSYNNLQLLSILTYQWKNFSIEFDTSLLVSTN